MKSYEVVEEEEIFDLKESVNNLISLGYRPTGGICTYQHIGDYNLKTYIFYQAMVKY